jgi:uncharacterized protein YeaO (DUF488 family)
MRLYTIQLAQWRKAKGLVVPLLDTTVRTGDKCFAPSWDMVLGVKSGELTEDEYTKLYKRKMLDSIKTNPSRWAEVLKMESVAVACYCTNGAFCHRYILAEILQQLCRHNHIGCIMEGELA